MSIYDLIKNEHREVEKLISKIERTNDPDKRFELFEQLREDLSGHSKAEERVLYARLRNDPAVGGQIDVSLEEHQGIELLLFQLADLEADDERFSELLQQLKEAVEAHVGKEETDLLPKARRLLGPDDDNALADRMMQEERRILDADEEGDLDSDEGRPIPPA